MAGHADDEVDMKKRKKEIELAAHPLPMRKKKMKKGMMFRKMD